METKISLIKNIIEKESYELMSENWVSICRLSKKGDTSIRYEIATRLKYFKGSNQIELLIKMVHDR